MEIPTLLEGTGQEMTSSESFADRLKALISQEGSVSALARKTGIPESTIRKWRDGGEPSLSNLLALANSLDLSIEWLSTGQESPRAKAPAAKYNVVKGEQGSLLNQMLAELSVLEDHGEGVTAKSSELSPLVEAGDRVILSTFADDKDPRKAYNGNYYVSIGGHPRFAHLEIITGGILQVRYPNPAGGYTPLDINLNQIPQDFMILGRVAAVTKSSIKRS